MRISTQLSRLFLLLLAANSVNAGLVDGLLNGISGADNSNQGKAKAGGIGASSATTETTAAAAATSESTSSASTAAKESTTASVTTSSTTPKTTSTPTTEATTEATSTQVTTTASTTAATAKATSAPTTTATTSAPNDVSQTALSISSAASTDSPSTQTTLVTSVTSGASTASDAATSTSSLSPSQSASLSNEASTKKSSGMSSGTKKAIIGVCVGVGGAALMGGLFFAAWRIWGRKRHGADSPEKDDLMGTAYNMGGHGPEKSPSLSAASNPFQSTLESYHNPSRSVNPSSNF